VYAKQIEFGLQKVFSKKNQTDGGIINSQVSLMISTPSMAQIGSFDSIQYGSHFRKNYRVNIGVIS
jgi:hypothetical protein